ncbi:MAG: hypothetical protein ETSY1_21165 [Candidatus Entotheonella factor]|uniref:Uncharacterized protein n=1 Tax=Entotheonella factor TaxID=1429438 RepID=W4LIW1_ENTF1|nr:MAG: hypothetical protein ETSY1_21165 [Candidatus Entotheonella factor]
MFVHANLNGKIEKNAIRPFHLFQRFNQRDCLDFASVFQSNSESNTSSISNDVTI